MTTNTLTAGQIENLRTAGAAAAHGGLPSAPALSAVWMDAIKDLPVGTTTFRVASDAFTLGYDLGAQGLDVLAELLDMTGHDYEVTGLGGNIRALRLRLVDNTDWLITGEGVDDYTAARYYDGDSDAVDSLDPITLDANLQRTDVLDLLTFRRTGAPFTD